MKNDEKTKKCEKIIQLVKEGVRNIASDLNVDGSDPVIHNQILLTGVMEMVSITSDPSRGVDALMESHKNTVIAFDTYDALTVDGE